MSKEKFDKTLKYLEGKEKILFLLTSNRWSGHKDDTPKSSSLAYLLQEKLGPNKVTIIDVSKLKIYECEGNVSSKTGNHCGMKEALLNSSDTLVEAFETCKILKSLEQVEKNAQKQNFNLKK